MSNMVPQAPTLNREAWARLEAYCRTLVGQNYRLFIVAGAYGVGGKGSKGFATTLNGRVSVPFLEALFARNAPLHDGGIILQGARVVEYSCHRGRLSQQHRPGGQQKLEQLRDYPRRDRAGRRGNFLYLSARSGAERIAASALRPDDLNTGHVQ